MYRLGGVKNFCEAKIFFGRIYSRHAESDWVKGRVTGAGRSRLGAVIARAASAFGRGGLFDSARNLWTARPFSPIAFTASRRCL